MKPKNYQIVLLIFWKMTTTTEWITGTHAHYDPANSKPNPAPPILPHMSPGQQSIVISGIFYFEAFLSSSGSSLSSWLTPVQLHKLIRLGKGQVRAKGRSANSLVRCSGEGHVNFR